MYFPVGWPKYLHMNSDSPLVSITSNPERILFAILTEHSISLWYCKVCIACQLLFCWNCYSHAFPVTWQTGTAHTRTCLIPKRICCLYDDSEKCLSVVSDGGIRKTDVFIVKVKIVWWRTRKTIWNAPICKLVQLNSHICDSAFLYAGKEYL